MGRSAVEGAADAGRAAVEDVGVDHGCLNILVTEEFLNRSDIVAIFEQVGGEGVAEGVGSDRFVHSGEFGRLPDCPLEVSLVEMVALFDAADGIDGELGAGKTYCQMRSCPAFLYFRSSA